jgi:hypothetical protein
LAHVTTATFRLLLSLCRHSLQIVRSTSESDSSASSNCNGNGESALDDNGETAFDDAGRSFERVFERVVRVEIDGVEGDGVEGDGASKALNLNPSSDA